MASVTHQLGGLLPRWQVVRGGTAGDMLGHDGALAVVAPFAVDDGWEGRAQDGPHVELVGEIRNIVAVDLITRSATMPGWAVRIRLEPFGGEIEMTQFEQRRLAPEHGLYVDFSGSEPEVVARTEDAVDRRPLSSRLLRETGFGLVADEAKTLLTDPVVLDLCGSRWGRPPIRPGRSQRSPHHYALWANRYVWALAQDPRRPVAHIVEADGRAGIVRTEREVSGQVSRARPQYLTRSAEQGKAGGELTEESKALLRVLGIEPGSDHVVTD